MALYWVSSEPTYLFDKPSIQTGLPKSNAQILRTLGCSTSFTSPSASSAGSNLVQTTVSLNSATSLGKNAPCNVVALRCSGFLCSLLVALDLVSFSSPSQNQSPITQVEFTTIFSAKLFTFSSGANRFSANPSLPDNRLAQEAMNLTLYHWWVLLDFEHQLNPGDSMDGSSTPSLVLFWP